jgi:hypothetical protein
MNTEAYISEARKSFHSALLASILKSDSKGIPSNADSSSQTSINIAKGILEQLGFAAQGSRLAGQMAGNKFEIICEGFLKETFMKLIHLRPGKWEIRRLTGRLGIARFDQYEHLEALERAAKRDPQLAAALGSDYLIKPDIIIMREPEEDESINSAEFLVNDYHARLTSLRRINNPKPILHASISCKWTLRSDRAQNARSEGLNLVRNRKGRLPHIAVVTGEPTPYRIASIALGTGDIDCVYHIALRELKETIIALGLEDSLKLLETMIQGKRLRDISDLPLDLVI